MHKYQSYHILVVPFRATSHPKFQIYQRIFYRFQHCDNFVNVDILDSSLHLVHVALMIVMEDFHLWTLLKTWAFSYR